MNNFSRINPEIEHRLRQQADKINELERDKSRLISEINSLKSENKKLQRKIKNANAQISSSIEDIDLLKKSTIRFDPSTNSMKYKTVVNDFESQSKLDSISENLKQVKGSLSSNDDWVTFIVILVIFVAVPTHDGSVYLTRGAIYSYYEFAVPISNRLTDEEWWNIIDSDDEPSMPEWMFSFLEIPQTTPQCTSGIKVWAYTLKVEEK